MARAKKQKKPLAEESREKKIERYLSEYDKAYTPDPSYRFAIGEEVHIGNLQDVIVSDILDSESKYYEIDYTNIDHNYGNPIVTPHCKRFVKWFDIRPIIENKHESLIHNEDLQLSYFQTSLEGLVRKKTSFGVDFDPEYQRGYVWEMKDKMLLIDSVFNCIDIGKFVFIHLEYGETAKDLGYEILDGKQRLSTLCDYYENRFAYNGLFYNDLSKREQSHFENYPVSMAEISNVTREQKLRYFLTLNRGGKQMGEEQLQRVAKMLEELESKK